MVADFYAYEMHNSPILTGHYSNYIMSNFFAVVPIANELSSPTPCSLS